MRRLKIHDEREARAQQAEAARLEQIESAMLRDEIRQEELEYQKKSEKAQVLRKQQRRLAKQNRTEKMRGMGPEARKMYKMKRRELVSSAIAAESKKIDDERSAFQHELDGARATIRRVEGLISTAKSADSLSDINKQLQNARKVERVTLRSLRNLSATKADRIAACCEEAESAALMFCENIPEGRGKNTGAGRSTKDKKNTGTDRAVGKRAAKAFSLRQTKIAPRKCRPDVELDLSDAATVAFDLYSADKVFKSRSQLRQLEIAIGMSCTEGGRDAIGDHSGMQPNVQRNKRGKRVGTQLISDSERRRNLFQQNSRHQMSKHMLKILPANLRNF